VKASAKEPNGTAAFDGSVRRQVYTALKADILGGTWDMGQRLSESQLIARYGTSRTPLREALTVLEREGLIEVVPRVGYVTSRMTAKDVLDIFELRILIEATTARKAATMISEAALDELDRLCSPYRPGDRQSYHTHLTENLQFHRTIAEAAGNPRMLHVLTQLLEHMFRLIVLRLDRSSGSDVLGEHQQIAAALRRRDPDLARDLMVRHLTVARQATIDAIMEIMSRREL